MWKYYAVLSAVFAALTAILAKKGVSGIDSNLATAIRTTVILVIVWGIVLVSGAVSKVREISGYCVTFLILSGIATGLSWLFYFKALQGGPASMVAPIAQCGDHDRARHRDSRGAAELEGDPWRFADRGRFAGHGIAGQILELIG